MCHLKLQILSTLHQVDLAKNIASYELGVALVVVWRTWSLHGLQSGLSQVTSLLCASFPWLQNGDDNQLGR